MRVIEKHTGESSEGNAELDRHGALHRGALRQGEAGEAHLPPCVFVRSSQTKSSFRSETVLQSHYTWTINHSTPH